MKIDVFFNRLQSIPEFRLPTFVAELVRNVYHFFFRTVYTYESNSLSESPRNVYEPTCVNNVCSLNLFKFSKPPQMTLFLAEIDDVGYFRSAEVITLLHIDKHLPLNFLPSKILYFSLPILFSYLLIISFVFAGSNAFSYNSLYKLQ